MFHADGWMDRHDEANSRLSQFCKSARHSAACFSCKKKVIIRLHVKITKIWLKTGIHGCQDLNSLRRWLCDKAKHVADYLNNT
jgi:hypothetical protein